MCREHDGTEGSTGLISECSSYFMEAIISSESIYIHVVEIGPQHPDWGKHLNYCLISQFVVTGSSHAIPIIGFWICFFLKKLIVVEPLTRDATHSRSDTTNLLTG